MIGSRAWFALMRRNLIYRKRYWLSSVLELVLPICGIAILIGIKAAVENSGDLESDIIPANFPNESYVFTPLSFNDYLTAVQAKRICLPVNDTNEPPGSFYISGYNYKGQDWQVPLIKCDSRNCNKAGQDAATSLCEYNVIGITGTDNTSGSSRVLNFISWMESKYPVLENRSAFPFTYNIIKKFPDSSAMDAYITSNNYGVYPDNPKLAMGIVFTNDDSDVNLFEYTLRQNSTNFNAPEDAAQPATTTTPPTDQLLTQYAKTDDSSCIPAQGGTPEQGPYGNSCTGQYMYNGILTFQRLINDYIIEQTGAATTNHVGEAAVQFVPFPSPSYKEAGFYIQLAQYAPILITLGLLYPVALMCSYIASEKELRQKELMKMMSVTESDIGWSWFITFFMFHFVTAIIVAAATASLYDLADFVPLFIFWLLTFIAIIVLCMTIAALTSKSIRVVLISVIVFFVGAFLTIALPLESTDAGLIFLISIHPVGAFSYGIAQIGELQDSGLGLSFDTIGIASGVKSGYKFSNTISSLLFDCIFWGIISWYFNRVIKPDYGQALPFYFPFLKSYWLPSRSKVNVSDITDAGSRNLTSNTGIPYEPVGENYRRQANEGQSIEIYNLHKVFGEKRAVDGLNLSMYSGQITALLGHNGAGKTTTIAMLTGAIPPTDGYATVAGKDIRTDMSAIRQDIGICLQHDCLFPMLTVKEHLQFFARLKGLYSRVSKVEAEEQIDQAIRDVALFEKRNTYSKSLSGGMKRKLSVAMAFSGGSKVVLLDEPTSGMDPFSRRFTWNVIRQYRQDRCIILTTHFMDEADILGDRIAIMAEGQLRCAGSSLFLKKTYGVGYQLTIEKSQGKREEAAAVTSIDDDNDEFNDEDNNDPSSKKSQVVVDSPEDDTEDLDTRLRSIIKSSVQNATLLNNTGAETRYQLPIKASSDFPPMFEGLDNEVTKGTIQSYGVSMTTLDEVFLVVARGEHTMGSEKPILASSRQMLGAINENDDDATAASANKSERSSKSRMDLSKEGLFTRHITALTRKRAANFSRDKKAWYCTTLAPTTAVLLGLILLQGLSVNRNLEPITLDLAALNADVTTGPQNPVSYNSPDDPFLCQPGGCSYNPTLVNVSETNEVYVFCGYQARIDATSATNTLPSCSIAVSTDVMNSFGAGATIQDLNNVTTISASSQALANTSDVNEASQYGAILFTHDESSVIVGTNSSFNDTIIALCQNQSTYLNYTNPDECATRFRGMGYVIQYNFTAKHVAPLFQALADEAIVRQATNNENFQIKVTIAPLPITLYEESLGKAQDAFILFFLVVISFPLISGTFGAFIVTERESKAKHLQTVAGVQPEAYWLSSFLWDVVNYQIPLWITIALFFIFDVTALTTSENDAFSALLAVLFLYGPAATSFTYCLTFAFSSPSIVTAVSIISGFLIGLAGPLAVFIMELIAADPSNPNEKLKNIANAITWILRFIPQFCLGKGIFYILNLSSVAFIEGEGAQLSAWSGPVVLYEIYFMIAESILYLLLAIQLDKWSTNPSVMAFWKNITGCCRSGSRDGDIVYSTPDDTDVISEEERVLSGGANSDLIVVSQLTKVFDNGKKAVNNLSLGIPSGECFGLLGINGAGKTTTMGILTAEFPPTSGDATLAGFSVSREPQKIRRRIGYCPQFDAHFPNMTGREHVELYASIKGVPKAAVKEAADVKLKEVGLNDFDSDRLCSNYSGGMKRRLSLAIATIGAPQIVFLDECSTGVDPVARREIWELISAMVSDESVPPSERTSVILTTHSMEECEALCPRIGIMANGRLRCLGSAQHLKNKFGQGFQLEMKTAIVDDEDDDYKAIVQSLLRAKGLSEDTPTDDIFFKLDEAKMALQSLTNDDFLSSMVTGENPVGYNVWRDSQSLTGATLESLAAFATNETRMRNIETFLSDNFSGHVLRERQDLKVRYEVSSEGTRISHIFGRVEESKERLFLADYGVSQTSLEQVFNMHAAEAEKLKQGRNDG